jgi:hypothetical protein
VAAFRLDQGIQLRFAASNRTDLHVLGHEALCQRPAKPGPTPKMIAVSRPAMGVPSHFFQDLDLSKIPKIITCETITRGA